MIAIPNAQFNNSNALQATRNTPTNNEIRVDGTQISWPDDGWYEVQSATSFNTISEGGRSATLPHGTYNLINHTTGERFENISVPDSLSDSDYPFSVNSPISLLRENSEPAVISIPTLVGDVNITVTPESDWEEIAADNAWGASGGIGIAVTTGMVTANPAVPAAVLAATGIGVVAHTGQSVDIDVETQPNAFSMAWRVLIDFINPSTSNPFSTTSDGGDSQGGISSADSAEDGDFGTDPEGEFGGLSAQPATEPDSQPTTNRPTHDPNRNSDSDTDNGPGGGGVSSSQSAENGGWGTSAGGEFD